MTGGGQAGAGATSGEGGGPNGGEGGGANPGPPAWAGGTPHVDYVGFLNGEAVDLDITNAADVATSFCERNYLVPDPSDPDTFEEAVLEKVELKLLLVEGAVEKEYQVELGGVAQGVTATYTIGQDGFSASVQWEFVEEGLTTSEFDDDVSSSLVVGGFVGAPGADGRVIPDGEGIFGGYAAFTLPGDEWLRLSFTVNCGDNGFDTL